MTISFSQIQIQRKSLPWKLIFIILCVNMYIVNGSFHFAPDFCATNKDCTTCADIGGCEWCSSTLSCMKSTPEIVSNCTEQCTIISVELCPKTSLNCSAIANCSTCASRGCAWCRETHKCYEPSDDGTNACMVSGLCDCPVVKPQMCPMVNTPCSEHKNCSSCTSDLSCGWCSSTGKCLSARVDGTGPCANGTCDKYWNYQNCSEQCSSYSSCDGCAADPDCSWCSGGAVPTFDNEPLRTSFCVYGKKEDLSHHCLAWHNETCPDCQKFNACDACVENKDPKIRSCGWCGSTSKCFEGNALGPFDEFDCTSNWTIICPSLPPVNPPGPVDPPTAPIPPPIEPPTGPPVEPPVHPPTTPISPPVNPPVKEPVSPIAEPISPPVIEPPITPPVAAPVPSNDDHRVDIIIGVSIGVVAVALVAVSWWRCTVQKRNRYRAIG